MGFFISGAAVFAFGVLFGWTIARTSFKDIIDGYTED